MSKETLECRLIYRNYHQRFYEISKKLKKFPYKNWDFDTALAYSSNRIKPEHKHLLEGMEDGIDIICVSDATTHTERLAFAGMRAKSNITNECFMFSSLQIDGKMTFMTSGGDSDSVYSDEVYLRRIASCNNMNFKLISNE